MKETFLIELYKEQMSYCRHHEVQRATMSNIILVISAALLGLTYFEGKPTFSSWPLSFLVIVVGCYAYFFSKKHYERFKWHDNLSDQYREKIEKIHPELITDRETIDSALDKQFGFVHRVGLNIFWVGIPVGVILVGVITLASVLTSGCS